MVTSLADSAEISKVTNLRYLIVDDEMSLRELLVDILLEEGCQKFDERDSLHLEETDFHSFDVIFLDVYMPEVDGIEVINRLAQINWKGELVLMSGNRKESLQSASELAKLKNINLVSVLEKPFSVEQIIDVLNQVGSRS